MNQFINFFYLNLVICVVCECVCVTAEATCSIQRDHEHITICKSMVIRVCATTNHCALSRKNVLVWTSKFACVYGQVAYYSWTLCVCVCGGAWVTTTISKPVSSLFFFLLIK